MAKILLSSFFAFYVSLFLAGTSLASYGSVACQPIYGGGQTCVTTEKISINKTVLNPLKSKGGTTDVFVDNLSINDPKYAPTQTVKFQLTVTNSGNSTLNTVTVYDILPDFVDFVSGPGNFDKNSRTLTFNLSNLNPNESRTYTIVGKVVSPTSMPSDQGVVCVVNQSIAKFSDQESRDNAQFCIERKVTTKGGLPVVPPPSITQTPPTGPEMLPLIGLIPTAGIGFLLRRKSK
ncbi:MAG: hypothetical protein ACD_37C00152G0003 [uncultured bacterium]|uniref:DUF11 domain-containing protein n=1 Tax=Candidatus Woesebacteria bacterium RBG_16_39_8b TaxID=1802482 RepID=A0A1F7XBV9_9BACT|nr:MAG: hypothetical protein ACD_37C00152G0003 [uncultured bacterium]KKR94356.1 MAG: hypothetical protein UU45_C0011G0010 [Candidatus Levybacteria bacterium GW2011_GWA2_41_15]KKS88126.1 MAG: hypothetical protein UV62_C0014G0007 [Parcubacteria group bacterium GW2011_GWC1_43_11]OGH44148.1 MAG: hypothetical protein A3I49_01720 [Candidatus Levybacteria bacterium RIFCSPLOWO2_02_FULL_37_11]OGM12507.1 MAG: hypothetical protein A2V80_00285 [Candidatus Woesebacteria bacterium RBG_16_39_8b]